MPERRTRVSCCSTATIGYVREHGVAELSLRRLAAAIGTSHRMLIYHFGSKQGLLVAIVPRSRSSSAGPWPRSTPTRRSHRSEIARRMWQHSADPSLWPNERLFFETYGQALQARAHTVDFLDDVVESWLGPIAEMRRRGCTTVAACQAVSIWRWPRAAPRPPRHRQPPRHRRRVGAVRSRCSSLGARPSRPLRPSPRPRPRPSTRPTTGSGLAAARVGQPLHAGRRTRPSCAPAACRPRRGRRHGVRRCRRPSGVQPRRRQADPLHPAVADLRDEIHRADGILFSDAGVRGSSRARQERPRLDDRRRPGELDRREAGRVDQRVEYTRTRPRRPRIAPEGARLRRPRSIVEGACAHIPGSRRRSSTPRASSTTTAYAPDREVTGGAGRRQRR